MTFKNSSIIKKMRRQAVKSIMDVVILAELKTEKMSGYDVISYIHEKFGVLISSGTVYTHLYALEREGLIVGNQENNKRVYNITQKGNQIFEGATKNNIELLEILEAILDK